PDTTRDGLSQRRTMIVASSGQIAPQTGHDHETGRVRRGRGGRGEAGAGVAAGGWCGAGGGAGRQACGRGGGGCGRGEGGRAGGRGGGGGDGRGGVAAEGVDVEGFGGAAQVTGQGGQAGDGVGDGVAGGGGRAAAPGQYRGDPEPAQRRQGGRPGDRGEKHGPFGQNLDQNAAGPDHQEGTERGIGDDAQLQFGTWRRGLAHHHPRAQAGGQVVVGGAGLGRAGQP